MRGSISNVVHPSTNRNFLQAFDILTEFAHYKGATQKTEKLIRYLRNGITTRVLGNYDPVSGASFGAKIALSGTGQNYFRASLFDSLLISFKLKTSSFQRLTDELLAPNPRQHGS